MARKLVRALSILSLFTLAWSFTGCASSDDDCHGSAPDVEPFEIEDSLTVGEAFELQFTSAFGDDAVWSVSSGELPPGLALDEFGLLAGTPTLEGEYSFSIEAGVDFSGNQCSQHPAEGNYTVVVEAEEFDG